MYLLILRNSLIQTAKTRIRATGTSEACSSGATAKAMLECSELARVQINSVNGMEPCITVGDQHKRVGPIRSSLDVTSPTISSWSPVSSSVGCRYRFPMHLHLYRALHCDKRSSIQVIGWVRPSPCASTAPVAAEGGLKTF